MISFNDVSVVINKKECLKNVSGCFPKNKITTILGPNGAGKTTLLRVLAGLLSSVKGHIHLAELDTRLCGLDVLARERSFLPAAADIRPHLRVWELLGLSPLIDDDILERLKLNSLWSRVFTTLSTGEKVRVLLAMTYFDNTSVWFLDEPLAHLDPAYQVQVLYFLRDMKKEKNKTIIMTSHDLEIAKRHADHVYLLRSGVCVASGSPTSALTHSNVQTCFDLTPIQQWAACLKIPQNKNTKNDTVNGKERECEFSDPPHHQK